MVILRPSIICCSYKEPYPGWCDTMAAAGGISNATALGVLKFVHGSLENKADLIPVDFVCNAILVSSAVYAGKPGLSIYHSSTTSSVNHMTW